MSRPANRPEAKIRLAGVPVPLPGGKPGSAVNGNPHGTSEPFPEPPAAPTGSELSRVLVDLRGTARFVLYLAEHVEEAFGHLPTDGSGGDVEPLLHRRLLEMYAAELVAKSQALGNLASDGARELRSVLRK